MGGMFEKSPCLMSIIALHGFLGLPSDWAFCEGAISYPVGSCSSLSLWAKKFNAQIKKEKKEKRILIGYSMGGRLALHALLDEPELWDHAVFIGTHPGLKDKEEKEKRLQSDLKWAERFLTEDWDSLMDAWESQSIFQNERIRPCRQEKDYDRKELASQLINFSLGKQEDLLARALEFSTTWIAGEKDKIHHNKTIVIPNEGHRLLITTPEKIKEIIFSECEKK